MSTRTEATLRAARPHRLPTARLMVLLRGESRTLRAYGPDLDDPCFMPLGSGRLCMLPGIHAGGCLPAPDLYPPKVTVAVQA